MKRRPVLVAVAVLVAVLVAGVVLLGCNDGGAGDQERPGGPAATTASKNNQAPMLTEPIATTTESTFGYDDAGHMATTSTTITLSSGCVDPDGDTVTFEWSATVGTLSPDGATVTWSRNISAGEPENGDVTIKCSDPSGLSDAHTIKFR